MDAAVPPIKAKYLYILLPFGAMGETAQTCVCVGYQIEGGYTYLLCVL